MGGGPNIVEIPLEETEGLFVRAFQTMDFKEANRVLARNGVKEQNAIQAVKNGVYDAVCWSVGRGGVARALTLSPREGVELQLTTFHNGEPWGHLDAPGNRDIEFPDGGSMVSVAEMTREAEMALAKEYGIALSPEAEAVRAGALAGREDMESGVKSAPGRLEVGCNDRS